MPVPRKKRPSIKDVAKLAGYSITTVSFVINNADVSIPKETRDRIWAAVEELGYRPNLYARGLRSNRTYTIAFISDQIATTPYAVRIIQGAQDKARENDYIIMMFNTDDEPEMMNKSIEHAVHDRQVDGVLLATMYHREVEIMETLRGFPTVLVDCFAADHSLPSVVPDEITGGRVATEYLLEKGHRRVGFINERKPVPAKIGRLKGYQQALQNYGIAFDESLVFELCEGIPEGGYQGVNYLMDLEEPPTAIFCFNDRMALGAYDALRNRGLSIPDDVAVIGYDNQDLIAADIYPRLTTMELPHYEMGQWGIEHLLQLISAKEKQSGAPIQKVLECPLIIRDSV